MAKLYVGDWLASTKLDDDFVWLFSANKIEWFLLDQPYGIIRMDLSFCSISLLCGQFSLFSVFGNSKTTKTISLFRQINLLLMINLIRVILQKLVFTKNRSFAKQGMKTALILVPIFGIQYVVHFVPIDPTQTCDPILLAILHSQIIIEGLQGTIVTLILCFLNKDVSFRYFVLIMSYHRTN